MDDQDMPGLEEPRWARSKVTYVTCYVDVPRLHPASRAIL